MNLVIAYHQIIFSISRYINQHMEYIVSVFFWERIYKAVVCVLSMHIVGITILCW